MIEIEFTEPDVIELHFEEEGKVVQIIKQDQKQQSIITGSDTYVTIGTDPALEGRVADLELNKIDKGSSLGGRYI